MIDNFGFLEGVPLILEQTLPDKFFGTSTVPTTIHGRAIYHIRMASSDHVFEPPTPHPTNWVVLFYTFTALGLYRDYFSSMKWQCSHLILMQLFLISSSNGLTLNSLSIAFSGLLLVVLSVMWRNLGNVSYLSKSLQLQYVHSGILETNTSRIFNIAIVICTPKKTSISF